jgi:hypothetical protein
MSGLGVVLATYGTATTGSFERARARSGLEWTGRTTLTRPYLPPSPRDDEVAVTRQGEGDLRTPGGNRCSVGDRRVLVGEAAGGEGQ